MLNIAHHHGRLIQLCHAQSLAATNCVTEQLGWLTVEFLYVLLNKLDVPVF